MIYELLPTGKENRISAKDLCTAANIADRRTLCSAIRRERINGALILSTKGKHGGYYKPANNAEIAEFIGTITREAKAMFFILKNAREAANIPEGQITIYEQ